MFFEGIQKYLLLTEEHQQEVLHGVSQHPEEFQQAEVAQHLHHHLG